MQRSKSVKKVDLALRNKPQGLNRYQLKQLTITQLRDQMKRIDPSYKIIPMKGFNKLSKQQKDQITKIRKDALIYAIDAKINKPKPKEEILGQTSYIIKNKGFSEIATQRVESRAAHGGKVVTYYYRPAIKRSDLSGEDFMKLLERLQRSGDRRFNNYVLISIRYDNGEYRNVRIEDLIKKEIYYAQSMNVIAQDYYIISYKIIHVAQQVAACKSEDYTEYINVMYGDYDQENIKITAKSYKSENSSCFIVIFKRVSKQKIDVSKVRKMINVAPKEAINVVDLPKIADIFKCGYVLYSQAEEGLVVQETYETQRELFVEILIKKGHALHLTNIPNHLRLKALSGINLQQKDIVSLQDRNWKNVLTDPSLETIQQLIDDQQHFMIHAPGGCGKTYIAKRLKNTILSATTGTAAKLLSGNTIDYILCKYNKNDRKPKAFVNEFGDKTHILIDECSMISSEKLIKIWNFCNKFGLYLILVGDVCQLEPVNGSYFFTTINWRDDIRPNFTLINLTIIKRQNNVDQQVFLNNMRLNKFDFAYWKQLRAQPMIENAEVIICSTNAIRQKYNQNMYKDLKTEEVKYQVIKDVFYDQKPEKFLSKEDQLLVNKEVMKESDVDSRIENFKIGCKVMITRNINVSAGITNGTFASIKSFESDSIVLDIQDIGEYKLKYVQVQTQLKGKNLTFQELPLIIAYAVTIHKAQGQSVKSAIIDINGLFLKGQLYVALSRVEDLKNIYIKGFGKQETIETFSQTNSQALQFTLGQEVICDEEQHLIDYNLKQLQGIKRKKTYDFNKNNLIYFDFETRNELKHGFMQQIPYYNHIHHFKDGETKHRLTLFDELWTGGKRCDVVAETYQYIKNEMLQYADLLRSVQDEHKYSENTKKLKNKLKYQIPTLIAYNGAGFDLHFIVQKMLNDTSIKSRFTINTIYKGTQLVCFIVIERKTGKVVLKTHDLCQVINMPLDKALKEFCKGDDQAKQLAEKIGFKDEIILILKNYTDNPNILKPGVLTPIYKYIDTVDGIKQEPVMDQKTKQQKVLDLNKELIAYANNDTEVLHILYQKVNNIIEEYFDASIFQFLTTGALAWYGFLINLPENCLQNKKFDHNKNLSKLIDTKLFKPEINEYNFIKQAMYGGRVAPRIHQIDEEQVQKDTKEQNRNCNPVYLDISGMYASIMKNEALPFGQSVYLSKEQIEAINQYIKGIKRIEDEQKNVWRNIYNDITRKYGLFIAEVEFQENPWNPEPIVPYKTDRTFFINDRRVQTISSLDIALIIQSGGTIYNISKVLTWTENANIMKEWIEKTLEIKNEGNRSGDSGKKAFGKLLANSTYGQTLKGDKQEKLQYIDNIDDAMNFVSNYELTNFIEYDNFDCFIGKSKINKFTFVSSRCQQIGVFVLAYTRAMIFEICEIAMPNRYNKEGIYEQPYNGDTDSLVFRKWQADLLIQQNWVGLENGRLTDELGEDTVWFNPPSAKKIVQDEKDRIGDNKKEFRYGLINETIYNNATEQEKCDPSNYDFTFIRNAIFSAPKSYSVQYNIANEVKEKMRFKGISKESTIKIFDEETKQFKYNTYNFDLIEKAYALRNENDDKKLVACLPNKPQVIKRPSKQEGVDNMFVVTNCNERRHVDKNISSAFKCVSRILFKTQWTGRYHYNDNITLPYGHKLAISFEQFTQQQQTKK